MEYLTTCYRRQGERGCSLLLQQYLCRQTPVCFACLCSMAGGEDNGTCRNLAVSLSKWSRTVPWHKAAGRPAPWLERLDGELKGLLEACGVTTNDKMKLTLFLCIDREMIVLGGGQNMRLLSTSFGRGRSLALPGQFRGCLEPGAGLLLATDGFLKNVEGKKLEEALRLQEIQTAEQAERRLKELASPQEPASPPELTSFGGRMGEPEREQTAAILLVGR